LNQNKQLELIKDVRNIETVINSGYGLDVMNEKRINMKNLNRKTRKNRLFGLLAAVFV